MKNFFIMPIILLLIMTWCQEEESNPTEITKNQEVSEKLNIITSFYPLAFFTEQIAWDKANVINLAQNKEVHDYTPSPQDIIKLNNADLVVYQWSELEFWADDIIPQLEEKNISTFEVSKHIKLSRIEEDHDDEHDEDDKDHDDKNDNNKEDHNHWEYDPHTWLDPVLAQDMIGVISEKLIVLDPTNTEFYKANANELKNKLNTIDQEFKRLSCKKDEAIISHDAFGYLAKRYNFVLHPIAWISSHDVPSAKVLSQLKQEASEWITHILTEENNVKKFAETLSRETDLISLPVYTMETNQVDYFTWFSSNLNSIKIALQCQ